MTLLAAAIGWAAGIAAGLHVPELGWVGIPASVGCAAAAWIVGAGAQRSTALAVLAACLGLGWGARTGGVELDQFGELSGQVLLVGRVADAPVPTGGRLQFPLDVVRVQSVSGEVHPHSTGARVLVRGTAQSIEYGDLIEARGRLAKPRSRPGYPAAELLARRGIARVVDAESVRRLTSAEPSAMATLHRLRGRLEATLRGSLPEPHASLVAGVLLGTRSGTPPELRSALAATGTSHVVAVSGFNVVVMAGAIELLLTRVVSVVGRRWALLPMFATVWCYTALVGAPPSAIRAAVMISLVFAARAGGRLPDPITVLAVAGAAMLGWDPRLAFDLSFQLSLMATAGLILFVAPVADHPSVTWLPRPIRDLLAVALAAQIATLPIILSTFHTLSLVSPLANVLIGPAVPGIMLAGGLLVLFGTLPGLGTLLSWLGWALSGYVLAAIDWAAGLPGAVVFTGSVPASVVAAWYGALLLWAAAGSADVRAWLGHRRYLGRGLAGAGLALLPMSALLAASQPDHVAVSVLDVGAPALFVRAGERTMLVTGAAGSSPLAASVGERLGLWERRIDLAVLVDRPELAAETLRRYPADLVVAPAGNLAQRDGSATAARALGGSFILPQEGQRIDLGEEVWVHVVDVREDAETAVLDVRVVAGELSVWLPGPGPASPRWREVAEEARQVVVRLPSRSLAWTRVAPNASWLAIVGDGLNLADRPATGSPDDPDDARLVLDQRAYGRIELVLAESGWSLQTERCPRGRGCVLVP